MTRKCYLTHLKNKNTLLVLLFLFLFFFDSFMTIHFFFFFFLAIFVTLSCYVKKGLLYSLFSRAFLQPAVFEALATAP